ncbi:excinuclease ABC subunit UvrC [soil metagenome]
MVASELRPKLRLLPETPGVYLMKDAAGEILYVGKAKSLRSRVRSYFSARPAESLKTRELVRRIVDFDTIVVDSEADALILENNLIKEHQPRFNISLRDDKTYPYIKVTVHEPFPRVFVTRKLQQDGARYFGPYTDVRRMRQALELVKRLYTVRSCRYRLPDEAPARPCLDYHIGRCKAPCIMLQSEADYRGMIDEIVDILSGHTHRAANRLREEMNAAAQDLDFERAAELRDALQQLEALESRQLGVDVSGSDRDVLGIARDGEEACGVVLRIREGKLLGRDALFLSNLDGEGDEKLLEVVAARFYMVRSAADQSDLPGEILLPHDFGDRPVLESLLREWSGRRVAVQIPRRGDRTRLVALAEQNARHLLEERKLLGTTNAQRAPDALYELQEVLELAAVPRTIVCFDVSHTQGSETVASAVTFENAEPKKSEYRKFRIKGEANSDDYRSMREVVTRYFRRTLEENRSLPDLVVIDGGKGQLSAACQALEEVGLAQQHVISLAKREEEIYTPGGRDPIRLPRRSAALRLLQRVRDEAHRFAVTYNRKLRSQRTIRSELSLIPGIGPARQRALLDHFGSLRAVGSATEDQIRTLPGFNAKLAERVRTSAHALVQGDSQPGERSG